MSQRDHQRPSDENIRPEVEIADSGTTDDERAGQLSGVILASRHRGPLPPREILEGYDALSPGSAKRMIDNVVRRSENRTEEEHKSAKFRRYLEPFYRIMAFSVVCLIVFLGYKLAELGATVVGFAFAVTAAGAFAGSFLLNARESRRDSRLIERLITLLRSETESGNGDD